MQKILCVVWLSFCVFWLLICFVCFFEVSKIFFVIEIRWFCCMRQFKFKILMFSAYFAFLRISFELCCGFQNLCDKLECFCVSDAKIKHEIVNAKLSSYFWQFGVSSKMMATISVLKKRQQAVQTFGVFIAVKLNWSNLIVCEQG